MHVVALVVVGLVALMYFGEPLCGCSTKSGAWIPGMKTALKVLVIAQENYFAEHGAYTNDLTALDSTIVADMPPSVTVTILEAEGDSWTARAIVSHSQVEYAGADCVAAVGPTKALPQTTMKHRSPSVDRPVACDMDGWSPTQTRLERWLWKLSD